MLGIPVADVAFDTDIIVGINSAFGVLNQLGVGPETVFSIEDSSAVWADFVVDLTPVYSEIKTYIYLTVKLVFDPAGTSFVLDSMSKIKEELGWRLMVKADPPPPPDPIPEE